MREKNINHPFGNGLFLGEKINHPFGNCLYYFIPPIKRVMTGGWFWLNSLCLWHCFTHMKSYHQPLSHPNFSCLVVYLPLWKIWKSINSHYSQYIYIYIWKHHPNVPNQPVSWHQNPPKPSTKTSAQVPGLHHRRSEPRNILDRALVGFTEKNDAYGGPHGSASPCILLLPIGNGISIAFMMIVDDS